MVTTAQGEQEIWMLIFPDRERNTGNLPKILRACFYTVNLHLAQGKIWIFKWKYVGGGGGCPWSFGLNFELGILNWEIEWRYFDWSSRGISGSICLCACDGINVILRPKTGGKGENTWETQGNLFWLESTTWFNFTTINPFKYVA